MSGWIVPVLLVAALLVLPGAVVGLAAGARPLLALATGPATTLGVVGIATVVLGQLDLAWTPLTAAGAVLLAALGCWVVARVLGRRDDRGTGGTSAPRGGIDDLRTHWRTLLGIAAAAVVSGAVITSTIGAPSTIPQGWDIAYHTGYSQWISSTGTASPLRAGQYLNYDSGVPSFYPAALHAVAALVITLTGLSSVVVINSVVVVIAGLLVPVAAACLATVAAPTRRWAAGAAAGVTSGFSILPYDQLWRPALPFATGIATACAAVLLLRHAHRRTALVPVAALAAVGATSAHPSALFFYALLVALLVLLLLLGAAPDGRVRVLLTTAAVGVLAAVALAPQLLAASSKGSIVTSYDYRLPYERGESVRRALLFGIDVRPGISVQLALAVAVAVGAVLALRHRRSAWLTACAAVLAVLTVQAASPFTPRLASVTSLFYNDPWRVDSLLALVGAALVGVAVDAVVGVGARVAGRRWTGPVGAVVAVAVVLALVVPYAGRNSDRMELAYDDHVVDASVVEGFEALRALAGTEGRVLNDPYDGSVWMYPVAGVRPVFGHYEVGTIGPDQSTLLDGIATIASNPAAQEAARVLDVHYVFVSARRIVPGDRVPTLAALPGAPGITQVFDNGTVQIYRIDALDGSGT